MNENIIMIFIRLPINMHCPHHLMFIKSLCYYHTVLCDYHLCFIIEDNEANRNDTTHIYLYTYGSILIHGHTHTNICIVHL